MMPAQIARLPDGRLHLHHGPIDILLIVEGPDAAGAEELAARRFAGILPELCAELPALRSTNPPKFNSAVARAMAAAVAPFRPAFITPMAAVAGAVADAVLAAMTDGTRLTRAIVNNGGDIALHLGPGTETTAAIARPGSMADRVTVRAGDGVGGLATSGWRGRSQSFGIADAVTVLAPTAAMADAAATMIANAVDLPGHPAITRRPATDLKADSDLGNRLVTTAVAPLSRHDARAALARGHGLARDLQARGLIAGAALFLQAESLTLGLPTQQREPTLA